MTKYFHKVEGSWVEWDGGAINGVQWPFAFRLQAAEDREPFGLFSADEPPVPEGKQTQSETVTDVDGRPVIERVFIDRPALTPADCPITMRQLRLGLKEFGGKRANYIQGIIDDIVDPAEQDAAQIWFDETTEVEWDNPMTQYFIAKTEFTEEQAATMWMAAYANIPR